MAPILALILVIVVSAVSILLLRYSGHSLYEATSVFVTISAQFIVLMVIVYLLQGRLFQYQPIIVQWLVLGITFFLYWVALMVIRLRPQPETSILLDLSRARQTSTRGSLLFGVMGVGLMIFAVTQPESGMLFFIVGFLWMMTPLYEWGQRKTRTQATTAGIFTGASGVRWERIRSYHWAKERDKHRPLIIRLYKRPPLFDVTVEFIPREHVAPLQSLLTEQVPAAPLPSGPQPI